MIPESIIAYIYLYANPKGLETLHCPYVDRAEKKMRRTAKFINRYYQQRCAKYQWVEANEHFVSK